MYRQFGQMHLPNRKVNLTFSPRPAEELINQVAWITAVSNCQYLTQCLMATKIQRTINSTMTLTLLIKIPAGALEETNPLFEAVFFCCFLPSHLRPARTWSRTSWSRWSHSLPPPWATMSWRQSSGAWKRSWWPKTTVTSAIFWPIVGQPSRVRWTGQMFCFSPSPVYSVNVEKPMSYSFCHLEL